MKSNKIQNGEAVSNTHKSAKCLSEVWKSPTLSFGDNKANQRLHNHFGSRETSFSFSRDILEQGIVIT